MNIFSVKQWRLFCVSALFAATALLPIQSQAVEACLDVFPSATFGNNDDHPLTPLVDNGDLNIDEGNDYILALTAGLNYDYDSIDANNGFSITVSGSGTARLHLTGNMNLRNNASINSGGDPERLVIYINGNLAINNNATINAIIYVNGNIEINNNGTTTGALSANGNIELGSHNIVYDEDAINSADFAGMCEGGSDSIALQAFLINTDGSTASTCVGQDIAISACADVDCNSILVDYAGTIAISVSSDHGDWSETDTHGSFTAGASDSGSASYSFDSVNDMGAIVLALADSHAETLTITVADSSAGVSTVSNSITFSDNVFVVESTDDLFVSGRPEAMTASLYTNDGSNCAINTLYEGSQSISIWKTDDAADPGGAAPTITATTVPDTESTDFMLNFTAGVASFDFDTTDVGKYIVSFQDDSLSFADVTIDGDISITTRPFGFYVAVAANPAAVDSSDAAFIAAGTSFSVSATAVLWQLADDANEDGIPDGHDDSDPDPDKPDPDKYANLADNTAAISFGQEGNGEAEGVSLTAYEYSPDLVAGINVITGTLTISSFSNGVGTTAVIYDNVGIIEIEAALTDNSYLGAANAIGASSYVGRFIPDHYEVINTTLSAAQSNFTYMDQPFKVSFDLLAVGADTDPDTGIGIALDNYKDAGPGNDYINLVIDSDMASSVISDITYGAVNDPDSTAVFLSDRLIADAALSGWLWSGGRITFLEVPLTFIRLATADGPYGDLAIGLSLEDGDGVGLSVAALDLDTEDPVVDFDKQQLGSSTIMRYGRVLIPPVYGPEINAGDLTPIPFTLQYWQGEDFVSHDEDSESLYDAWSEASCIDGSISCSEVSFSAAPTLTTIIDGASDIAQPMTISRPGEDRSGDIILQIDVDDWLEYDWSGTGDENPSALITFGSYRGHDRIIYRREIHTP